MKFNIKNLGKIKSAELELGDLTIICGENNTGKTYIATALYGFLLFSRGSRSIMGNDKICSQEQIKQLITEGRVRVDIAGFDATMKNIINFSCNAHPGRLPIIFASSEKYFEDASFSISFDKEKIDFGQGFSIETFLFNILKEANDTSADISLAPEAFEGFFKDYEIDERRSILNFDITEVLYRQFFDMFLPNPFIVNTERTGIATFMDELNFARNKLLRGMHQVESDAKLVNLFREVYKDYPLSINSSIDFDGKLKTIAKRESYIAKKHSEILDHFSGIVGGKYIVKDSGVYYRPEGSKNDLTMNESSSSVRALLDLAFYIQHHAQKGDILMIDEPELNLHPKNQREMARLLAMLVNAGIKVFITTHSDYIVYELNTLMLLNSEDSRLQKIAKDKGYEKSVLLSPASVKLYKTEKSDKSKVGSYELKAEAIDENGINTETFNEVINEMSEIQQEILFGGD